MRSCLSGNVSGSHLTRRKVIRVQSYGGDSAFGKRGMRYLEEAETITFQPPSMRRKEVVSMLLF